MISQVTRKSPSKRAVTILAAVLAACFSAATAGARAASLSALENARLAR